MADRDIIKIVKINDTNYDLGASTNAVFDSLRVGNFYFRYDNELQALVLQVPDNILAANGISLASLNEGIDM